MTETAPEHPREPLPLDSTAQLLTRITSQLGNQLSLVSLNGTRRPMHRTRRSAPTLVAVAHGSRDPRALHTVLELLDRVRELRPALDVRLGHIELNEPLLPDTLDAVGPGDAVLVPLLLGRGHHVRHDLPLAAAAATHLRTRVAAPLGPHPLLVEALHERLLEAGFGGTRTARTATPPSCSPPPGRATPAPTSTRGAPPPCSATASAGCPSCPRTPRRPPPTSPAALRALAARGRHRVALASYFTAPGRFATVSAAAAPGIAAAPLGAHPAMARLLLHRYDQALATTAPGQAPLTHPHLLATA